LFTASQPPPLPPFNNPVPEQVFLAKNYDENSKKSDRDPRGAFRNPAEFAGASAGIVGPLGSSSFNLPNVERALSEMGSGIGTVNTSAIEGTRRLAGRAGTTGRPGLSPLGTSSSPTNVGSVRSPGSPSANTGTPGATSQHEVLQNFFQSLLSTNTKDRTANAAAASRGAADLRTNGLPNGMGDSSM
jgi:dynein light intermediate chain 1